MALIRIGPIVQAISGRLGTTVFHTGGRSNVIARIPTKSRPSQEFTQLAAAAIAQESQRWAALAPEQRAAWNSFARTIPRPNRLGIRRAISGFQAFLTMHLAIQRRPRLNYGYIPPPTGATSELPTIASLSFTQGGPYNVVVSKPGIYNFIEHCYIQRHIEFGTRRGQGSYRYVTSFARTVPTLNYYASFQTAGITLLTGEQIRIYIRWIALDADGSPQWPSPLATATSTVL